MKTNLLLGFAIISALFLTSLASAACNLQVSLLNQDPFPAVPGDYVKLVFQVAGIENSDCQNIYFQLVPEYPISFDPTVSSEFKVSGGDFLSNYKNSLVIPYKVRLDENAINGDNPITVKYSTSTNPTSESSIIQKFNITVKDSRTTFEAYVKNFDFTTNTLTIQILNSGKSNVDALTIEIPQQNNVTVKGSNRNIIGSLDANEYTTSDFEVVPVESDISLNIFYTDQIGIRRTADTIIHFTPSNFENRKTQQQSSSTWIYVVVIIVIIIIYIIYRRYKKNKHKKLHSG